MPLYSPACMKAPYPECLNEAHISPSIETAFEKMFNIVYAVRNIRAEMQMATNEKTELFIWGAQEELDVVKKQQEIILALTPTSQIHWVLDENELPFGSSMPSGPLKLVVPIPETLKAKEKARLEKELEKLNQQLSLAKMKLANEDFKTKAPPAIVEHLENQRKDLQQQISMIAQRLQALT